MPEMTIREKTIEISLQRPFRESSKVQVDREMLWMFKDYALGHVYKYGKVVAIGVWRRDELARSEPGKAKCALYLCELVYSHMNGLESIPRKSVIHKNGNILDNRFSNLAMNVPNTGRRLQLSCAESVLQSAL
jgi:hypothetical protein